MRLRGIQDIISQGPQIEECERIIVYNACNTRATSLWHTSKIVSAVSTGTICVIGLLRCCSLLGRVTYELWEQVYQTSHVIGLREMSDEQKIQVRRHEIGNRWEALKHEDSSQI